MQISPVDFLVFLALFAVLGFIGGMLVGRNAQRLDRRRRRLGTSKSVICHL